MKESQFVKLGNSQHICILTICFMIKTEKKIIGKINIQAKSQNEKTLLTGYYCVAFIIECTAEDFVCVPLQNLFTSPILRVPQPSRLVRASSQHRGSLGVKCDLQYVTRLTKISTTGYL